ncbi:protein of unknown function [Bradyrhizobium vignae]|uniref:Uncharacterized protein n=1 Tax=Bradyrhizobium vignae TaxID=1549949 RepID=A0A2U3QC51_9BRAD|nr:protein of unknown function [Bradyrhizobium vignae]
MSDLGTESPVSPSGGGRSMDGIGLKAVGLNLTAVQRELGPLSGGVKALSIAEPLHGYPLRAYIARIPCHR